jgi:hypothetical protein
MSAIQPLPDLPTDTADSTGGKPESTGADRVKFSSSSNSKFETNRNWFTINFGNSAPARALFLARNKGALVYKNTAESLATQKGDSDSVVQFAEFPKFVDVGNQVTFSALQEWEGCVTDVNNESMFANLIDLSNAGADSKSIQAEIPLDEFSEQDLAKVAPGRIFRWAIGYQRTPAGTKMRGSQFVFRDLPQWSDRDLADAAAEANKLRDFFNSHDPKQPFFR